MKERIIGELECLAGIGTIATAYFLAGDEMLSKGEIIGYAVGSAFIINGVIDTISGKAGYIGDKFADLIGHIGTSINKIGANK